MMRVASLRIILVAFSFILAASTSVAERRDTTTSVIQSYAVDSQSSGAVAVKLRFAATPAFTVLRLDSPPRFALDIANVRHGNVPDWVNVDAWAVASLAATDITTSAWSGVRVTVELRHNATATVEVQGSDLIIHATPLVAPPSKLTAASTSTESRANTVAQVNDAEAKRLRAEAEVQRLRDELDKNKKQTQEQSARLTREMQTYADRTATLEDQASRAREEAQKIKAERDSYKNMAERAAGEKNDALRLAEETQRALAQTTALQAEQEKNIKNTESLNATLTTVAAQRREDAEAAGQRVNAAELRIEQARKRENALNQELQRTNRESTATLARMNEAKQELANAERALHDSRKQHSEQSEENRRLSQRVAEQQARLEKLTKANHEASGAEAQATQTITEYRREMQRLEQQAKQSRDELAAAKRAAVEAQRQQQESEALAQQALRERARMQEQVQRLEQVMAGVAQEKDDAERARGEALALARSAQQEAAQAHELATREREAAAQAREVAARAEAAKRVAENASTARSDNERALTQQAAQAKAEQAAALERARIAEHERTLAVADAQRARQMNEQLRSQLSQQQTLQPQRSGISLSEGQISSAQRPTDLVVKERPVAAPRVINSEKPTIYRDAKVERVIIPLRRAQPQVRNFWDRTAVMLMDSNDDLPRDSYAAGQGGLVTEVRVSRLRSGVVSVQVELNRPASPSVNEISNGGSRYLQLTYLQ